MPGASRLCSAVFGLVWLVLLLAPPAVSASATTVDKWFSADFSISGSNGYVLSVNGQPKKGVSILATDGHPRPHNFSLAEYTVQGAVSVKGVEADFGSLGKISVRFKPSGVVRTKTLPKTSKGCRVPHTIVRRMGTFVGTIRFTGEAGYTTAEAVEARGSIGTPEATICIGSGPDESGGNRHHEHRRPRPPAPYLGATATDNRLGFAASSSGLGKSASFVADAREKSGKVSIFRFLVKGGPPSSFEVDPGFNSASVAPPPPFSGTATFQRGPKGAPPSWSGSLAVSFLGEPDVPLTGPSFTFATLQKF